MTPQDTNLSASPSSVVLSASSGGEVAFSVVDKATTMENVTFGQGSCSGVAAYSFASSNSAIRKMSVIGQAPGVTSNTNPTGYGVSPLAPGTCELRLNDTLGNVATIFVTVTK
ncbi:MAG: hypothetical protein IAI50_04275 [Candidatus Eremiobacteraeota bacterium]|nr:hypothetical protein [Candidatus Eremiobacteraeota bacterium]